ncbi:MULTISPECIES: nitroreductase family protein [unclassified Burkholderia]|uniref:nitroreductase family protein n=1 Tax=unclassified Burkholderia TaxID=2613784 RepID=UPI000F589797|nr:MULTISPECIES: nitroreductase family protein [unclassified Burkholderia]RQS26830.1 nitroreductase [Burkholderia sp. Bp8995]RQS51716.1 nitroreductase [Burkholderia sp. Bp8989]
MNLKPASTEIDIHELLAGRWSPRAFSDRPISGEQLGSILEAARWAPSSFNMQPWRFLVFDRSQDPGSFQEAFATLVPFNQMWNERVPVLVCVATDTIDAKGKLNRTASYDAGAAAMALMLQAHALGLAAHAMAGFDIDAFRQKFSVPNDIEILTIIAIGHHGDPAALDDKMRKSEAAPRSRRPLKDLAFNGKYGRGFWT